MKALSKSTEFYVRAFLVVSSPASLSLGRFFFSSGTALALGAGAVVDADGASSSSSSSSLSSGAAPSGTQPPSSGSSSSSTSGFYNRVLGGEGREQDGMNVRLILSMLFHTAINQHKFILSLWLRLYTPPHPHPPRLGLPRLQSLPNK